MGSSETVVIVGAGLAGARAAEALRDQGFEGKVVLLRDETERPYLRPPLSKDYLRGRSKREKIFVHPQSWYADHDVDLRLQSSDPDIYAAGDVASAYHPVLGKYLRVEHWANARDHAAVAAAAMLGRHASYDRLPYFFSDQYELGMEYYGYVEPGEYDRVVFRGDTNALEFVAFWLRDRRVLAAMNVNVWDQAESLRALVRSRKQVDATRLGDPRIPLRDVLPDDAASHS